MAGVLLLGSSRPSRLLAGPARPSTSPHRHLIMGTVAVGIGVVAVVLAGELFSKWLAFIVAGGEITGTVIWLVSRGVTQRRATSNERQVIRACSVMAGQLDTGEIPARALTVAAEDAPLLTPTVGALAVGGDVAAELTALANQPGCAGLADMARGWRLCERTGMPLAPLMRQVADSLIQLGDIREQRRAELASSRSTSRLLAGLPVVGLGMGFLVSANPLDFLAGSLAGHLCLIGAATLASVGLIWTEVLTREDS
ncbi:MAG: pilus assembly protein TadB [Propionibacteriaceae bacterium]|nr:pilus assembly protein TadB [Propionibacteriaceae bacterium]